MLFQLNLALCANITQFTLPLIVILFEIVAGNVYVHACNTSTTDHSVAALIASCSAS